MIAGRESPQSTLAMSRCAKNTSALEKMFPLHKSGTTRMSATPATGPSTPLCRAASGEMALSSASGPAMIDLLVDVRGDVDRHVRDDYERVDLGHLDEQCLAQQLARLAKARLLVQDRVHEGRGRSAGHGPRFWTCDSPFASRRPPSARLRLNAETYRAACCLAKDGRVYSSYTVKKSISDRTAIRRSSLDFNRLPRNPPACGVYGSICAFGSSKSVADPCGRALRTALAAPLAIINLVYWVVYSKLPE